MCWHQKNTWKAKSTKRRAEWECLSCRPYVGKSWTTSLDLDEDSENEKPTYQAGFEKIVRENV